MTHRHTSYQITNTTIIILIHLLLRQRTIDEPLISHRLFFITWRHPSHSTHWHWDYSKNHHQLISFYPARVLQHVPTLCSAVLHLYDTIIITDIWYSNSNVHTASDRCYYVQYHYMFMLGLLHCTQALTLSMCDVLYGTVLWIQTHHQQWFRMFMLTEISGHLSHFVLWQIISSLPIWVRLSSRDFRVLEISTPILTSDLE